MKKAVIFLVAAVIAVGGYFAFRKSHAPGDAVAEQTLSTVAQPASGAPSGEHGLGTEQPSAKTRYGAYEEALSVQAYKQDAVAIEQLVELNGACKSATVTNHGMKADADMIRLQEFCRGYRPGAQNAVNWSKSYSAIISAKLDQIRSSKGPDAVSRELGQILAANAKPQEARDVLQYAAQSGIVPDSLKGMVDPSVAGTSVQRDQLETLAHVEFCRRGGDCGSNDFSTLVACVALGPCQPGDGLLSLVRRKSTPENFEAAQKMSEALRRG